MNTYLDQDTLKLIQNAINAGWVSVYYDPSGQIKEYTTLIPGNLLLNAEKYLAKDDGITQYYDYTIAIDDTIVAEATIPTNKKFYSPQEQDILSIYKQMSEKVIFQEMATINPKTYNA
ncbi:MAG: hypothetical protein IJX89_02790 [Alphaproteobacteria bacterium]|nr:hypothetical protein [Alphaproteobacteria bacterium]